MVKQDKGNSDSKVVRRVKASSDKEVAPKSDDKQVVRKVSTTKTTKAAATPSKKPVKKASKTTKSQPKKPVFILFRPFVALGRYFRDSWRELRQVRWPNRRATWALTLAVILFSLFFVVFIMLFDWLFNYLMQEVIL